MKKIKSLLVTAFVATLPMLLGATPVSTVTIEQVPPNQLLILDGKDFGLSGPLSIKGEYSKKYGPVLNARYSQILNDANALALLVDAGSKEYRLGFTLGHRFTLSQRLKFTFEHLAQNKDFDFVTGSVHEWTHQNALGLAYQFIRPHQRINTVDVSAYYAKANNESLNTIDFTSGLDVKENLRRIAGATTKGATVGVGLKPTYSNLVNLMLHYDDVDYDTKYDTSSNHYSGIGGTITYEQLLSDCLKVGVLGSLRKPYNLYQMEIAWLVHPYLDSQLEFALEGSHLTGHQGIENDNRLGLNITYRWGMNFTHKERKFKLGATSDTHEFNEWTSTPAVHFEEVLARADEKTIDKMTLQKINGTNGIDTPIIQKTLDPQHGYEGLLLPTLLINKYELFTNPIPSRGAMTLSVTGLPKGLTFIQDEQQRPTLYHADKIEGMPEAGSAGTYTVTITAHNEMGNTPQTFKMTIDGGAIGPPIIDPISDQRIKEKTSFILPIKIFSNPVAGDSHVTVTGLPKGLSYNADKTQIEGTPTQGTAASSPYTVTIKAKNDKGDAKAQTFKISIYTAGIPVIEPIADQTAKETVAFKLPLNILSDPEAGTLHVTLNGLPQGLSFNETKHSIEGTPAAGTAQSTPYVITINATNDTGTAKEVTFKLTVQVDVPPAILACPSAQSLPKTATVKITVTDSKNNSHQFKSLRDGQGTSYRVAETRLNSNTFQCVYEDAEGHHSPTIILETNLSGLQEVKYKQHIRGGECYPRPDPSYQDDCQITFN